MLLREGLLNRMDGVVPGQSLDCQYIAAVQLSRKHQTGVHRLAVDNDGASAALADAATFLRTFQIENASDQFKSR